MNKSEYILSSVKNRISKIDPGIKIILFGSRARKNASDNSDWDFLFLTKLNVTRQLKNRISDELFETELETEEVLTSLVQNVDLWEEYAATPLYENILNEGIVL